MADIDDFVKQWNFKFPVDYWWRRKHSIAFNSPEHRNSNFWDQMYEYYEDVMYKSFEKENEYEPNKNDWLKIKEQTYTKVEDGIENALAELEKFKKSFKG